MTSSRPCRVMQGESEKDMTIKSFEKKGFIINKPFEVNGKKFEVSPTMHGFHYRLYCNGECIFTRANLDTCYSKIIELVEQAAG